MNRFLLVLLIVAIFTVFYFSWLPDPKLGSEKYIPTVILNWSNTYFNIRTAIPFLFIGFLLELISKNKSNQEKIKGFFKHTLVSASLVCFVEIGQHFILNRHPDIMDVLFGIIGSVIGGLLYFSLSLLKK